MQANRVSRHLSILLPLFVGSGCAALIYEIVWFQLLEFVIGSTAVSMAVLLGTFMGGMCLGSLALPRIVDRGRHPLRIYAILELCIGLSGLAVLVVLPRVGELYAGNPGQGLFGVLLRGLACAACLLPPTIFMGATLPAVSRWVEATPSGVSWLGLFYGGNTVGAVVGCLAAGFYLLRVHDMPTATFVAAAINFTIALAGFALSSLAPSSSRAPAPVSADDSEKPGGVRTVHIAIALSGMAALGAEVVWTRLLSLLLGTTVYTFSIILAVFLIGIGSGGTAGAFAARRLARPRLAFGLCQLGLTLAIAWAAVMAARTLAYWPVGVSPDLKLLVHFQLDFARCMAAVLPAALLWGASFPLALAAAATPGGDPGRLVGGVYAANTLGAIAGAVLFSLILMPRLGSQQSERCLVAIAGLSALFLLIPLACKAARQGAAALWMFGVVAATAGLILAIPKTPGPLIAYGRSLFTHEYDTNELLYFGEGMNSSIAVSETKDGIRNFHVSGKVEASNDPEDMRLERMLGHLSALVHADPHSVLVVGCGAGITAGTFVTYPDIQRIVICDIEPLIPSVVSRYFALENYGVMLNPRVTVICDDARHFVLTTREKFDIVTSDPIHPWVKGSASLYTEEYFQMCKAHLNPGGVVTQWVPLYQSDEKTVKSEIATFFKVFPGGIIMGNAVDGEGYDVVLLGQAGPTRIDVDALQKKLELPEYARVASSLSSVGFSSVVDLLSTYAGQASDLAPWLADAQINHDRNLRLQYLAGLALDTRREAAIYRDMLNYRHYPDAVFAASEMTTSALRMALDDRSPWTGGGQSGP